MGTGDYKKAVAFLYQNGFPIGGVAAMDVETGVISPGGNA